MASPKFHLFLSFLRKLGDLRAAQTCAGDAEDGGDGEQKKHDRERMRQEDHETAVGKGHGLIKGGLQQRPEDEADDHWPGRELEPAHPVAEDAEQDEAEDVEQVLVDGVGADKGEDGHGREDDVLSGAAMNVCYDDEELENFLKMAAEVSKEYPVVVSQFLENTKEIEFDAVAQNGEVVEYAISEHIEFAGVHSGDATLVFPAQKIYFATARRIKKISRQIAKELNISGPFNIQFLARNNEVKVIECNLRASRSFPFVSKVLKRNFIETATRIMLDAPYNRPDKSAFDIDWIGVKASQFSFSRLHKADPVLGVDMSSTGEVGCIGDDFSEALLNAMIATGFKIPEKGVMFSSGAMKSKVDLLEASRMLFNQGYKIYATAGTAAFLNAHGVDTTPVYWPDEKPGAENNVMKMIADHKFDLIVNIPKNHSKRELTNGYRIRRGAIDHNIPLITNARLASAFIEAFCDLKLEDIQIKSWQEYK